jgi:hypothetical protein
MASVASFYFAMFKRFQAICGGAQQGHANPDSAPANQLYGGFSVQSTQDAQGIFKKLGPQAASYPPLSPGLQPLNPNSNDPLQNPLWQMLNASLVPGATFGASVVVAGQTWPAMPPPPIDEFQIWVDANATSPRLIDAFGDWITAGKIDDSPQDAPYNFASLSTASVAPWPLKNLEFTAVLFVASMPNDSGRRPGDGALPNPPALPVPANFWATSQIALSYPPGVAGQTAGKIANPTLLKPTEEYWVLALIGNAGTTGAGPIINPTYPKVLIQGDAQCFNTFTSPGTSLPPLDNIDPLGTNVAYEQHYTAGLSHDVVGFRFNVDQVFSALAAALTAQVPPAMLGQYPGGGMAARGPSLRQGADHVGRAARPLPARRRGAPAARPQQRPVPADGRPPHRPAQPGAVQPERSRDEEDQVGELHRRPGGGGVERARPGDRAAGRRHPFLVRGPARGL